MPLRGILFDLDGTLVDRRDTLEIVAQELAAAFTDHLDEIDPADFSRVILEADNHGYREKAEVFQLWIQNLPWISPPTLEALLEFWITTYPKCTQAMRGAHGVLESLRTRGLKLGIVTNGTEQSQWAKIERLDFPAYVESIVISEAAGVSKPDPGIFELALSELDLAPAETYFVGDHPVNDIAGSQAAGLTPIWLCGQIPWPDPTPLPQYKILRLTELLHLIDRVDR